MAKLLHDTYEKYRYAVIFSFMLLFCLLIMRFIITLVDFFSLRIPFRMMLGLDVAFIFIIPVLLVLVSANKMDIRICFFLPFLIYGIIFPICDALFLDPFALLGSPQYYISFLISGVGLGLFGVTGKMYSKNFRISLATFTIAILITMLNSINIIPVFYYVLTGDVAALQQIPNFF